MPLRRAMDGALPPLFPANLMSILVAGNESLPNGENNTWNKSKSITLLRFYGENDDTDNEDENSSSSRARRLRVAKKIGLTQTQLNFSQMTL